MNKKLIYIILAQLIIIAFLGGILLGRKSNKNISEILRMMTGDVSGKAEGKTNFLFGFEEIKDKLEAYHNKIKSSICTNDDFRGSINLWSSKNNTSVVSY